MSDDQIIEVVDEIADDVDPVRVEREAQRLGITVEELMHRVTVEILSRNA